MSQTKTDTGEQTVLDALEQADAQIADTFDPSEWTGISTLGFAHIHGIDGIQE
jgi:hypothetical protein